MCVLNLLRENFIVGIVLYVTLFGTLGTYIYIQDTMFIKIMLNKLSYLKQNNLGLLITKNIIQILHIIFHLKFYLFEAL